MHRRRTTKPNQTMKLTDSASNARCEFRLSTAESVAYLFRSAKRNFMDWHSRRERHALAIALSLVCLFGLGCDTMLQNVDDYWPQDQRVKDYRERGCSQKDAERNAFEDEYFEGAERDP